MLLPLYNEYRADGMEEHPPELRSMREQLSVCRERHGVDVCSSCIFFDECDKVKSYLRWVEAYRQSRARSEGGSE